MKISSAKRGCRCIGSLFSIWAVEQLAVRGYNDGTAPGWKRVEFLTQTYEKNIVFAFDWRIIILRLYELGKIFHPSLRIQRAMPAFFGTSGMLFRICPICGVGNRFGIGIF